MSLKILFMGTPEFSVPILKSIYKTKHKILTVYTQPPTKKLRGQKIVESPVHKVAKELKINTRYPSNINLNEELNFIKNLNPDIVIVAAYGQIISEKLLKILENNFINVHASLLPRWRGAAPIQRSIMEMDEVTGVTIMKIVTKLDAGPYALQKKVKIEESTTQEELSKRLSEVGAKLIVEFLDMFESRNINFKDQDQSKVTYAKKILKTESEIKWNIPAKNLSAKINGLSPFPGAWFRFKKDRIKILKAKEVELNGKIGEVLNDDLTVGCLKNAIKILRLQKEGRKAISNEQFLAGNSIKKGEFLN
jgi:methionyl-tRNA formyltransferase